MRQNILIILFLLIVVNCASVLYDYGGKIIDIKFSDAWDGQLGTPDTLFAYGVKKVYYEITFEGAVSNGFMVKKIWQIPARSTLESVSFMPKYSLRICGELHHYDTLTDMNAGSYLLSVQYYENGTYNDYEYGGGVHRTFIIQ